MHIAQPPHALASTTFAFPAIAGLASRLPLGGGREVALAVLAISRLATGLVPADALPAEERQARAAGARVWLASLALPAALRVPLTRAVDASASTAPAMATALRTVASTAGPYLDGAASLEIDRLVRRLVSTLGAVDARSHALS